MKNNFSEAYFKPYGNDSRRTFSYREQLHWISSFLELEGAHVLDYGCGLGEFMKFLNERASRTYGCDVSSYAVRVCKEFGLNSRLMRNGMIPFRENFDLVVMRGVFQHLWSPNETLLDIYHHLKPGGLVAILSTPNTESLCFRLFGDLPTLTKNLNLNLPSKSSLIQHLSVNKFEIIEYRFPYLNSGYAKPIKDFYLFCLKILNLSDEIPAFPGNVMEFIGKKC